MTKLASSISLGVAALLAALGLAACEQRRDQPGDASNDRPVLVSQPRLAAQSQPREFVATIRPRVESDLGFRVTGKVVKRFVQAGQKVRAGAPLAALDENDLKLQAEQAEAEFSAAKMVLAQALGDEKRALALRKNGWTTDAALDRIRAAAQEARGRQQRAERALELSRNSIDYATLRADGDGVVTQTLIEPGQVMIAGQTAIKLAHSGELEAAVSLPEDFVPLADKGTATLTLWSNKGKTYQAKLRELSPAADAATRTFAARYSILDPDQAVQLGMSATLAISAPGAQTVMSVPLSALYNQGDGPSVWKVGADSRLTLAPVKLVRYASDAALVSGLSESDQIVVLGVHKLEAGRKVRVMTRQSL
ncbi:efflux RND transporter periplasmic adaptor subunit [Methylocystis sp. MJC1]|jgi:RND family efflux transporter MFP subunit|uniref:efflux RND transporter periplasmic adaptor subunit n=1 Tax=Methylocystis sp. MJC1 TaxID=2654282 RepID=UPI0013EC9D3F|nr:efflux RND transporter periplasmic adaptor subunit [Methylocystis sp. MJC1]KAF2991264.1 Multidrug resistance protein MdtA [Methylocystis sp. MJC1]MBU6526197.1 efflux RND transporter periplasmic adaptor subunit [Methylocystis sp. MJC1]UZX12651.1 efflux RND transporter periplasmic adaptor subunit [Methylocystis sp. MJC1]